MLTLDKARKARWLMPSRSDMSRSELLLLQEGNTGCSRKSPYLEAESMNMGLRGGLEPSRKLAPTMAFVTRACPHNSNRLQQLVEAISEC